MTWLGEPGGRHKQSTGWDFGASPSFLPATLLPSPKVSAQPGTTMAFLPL